MRRSLPFVLVALLAGCATPAERITDVLVKRGVPQSQAKCMGSRLGERLTLSQLDRLQQLAKSQAAQGQRFSVGQFADSLNQTGDPKLVSEVLKAGLHCIL